MLSSLVAIVLWLLLVGLCYGVGRLLFRRLTAELSLDETKLEGRFVWLERFVLVVPVGMGVVGLFVWVCGLLGFLPKFLFYVLLALGVPGGVWLLRDAATKPTSSNSAALPVGLPIIAGTVFVLLGLFTLISALAPPSGLEWDALSYHLAAPKVWLSHGRIDYLAYDHHSNFPFVVQMLYLVMLGVGSVAGAKLVHYLCFVLLTVSVYTFAVRHITPIAKGRIIGLVAGVILAATPIVLWEATVAYVDLATALFTWLALYALINAAEATVRAQAIPNTQSLKPNTSSVSWLVLSAVLMGFALGTKYTVLGFWGLMGIGILGWHVAFYRTWAKETLPHAVLWGAISLTIGLPWYIKNWVVTGNPVYPFAYEIFGGRFWSAENAAQYSAEQARFGMGKAPLDLLLSPWQVTNEFLYLPAYQQATGRGFIFTEYLIFGLSPVFVGLLLMLPLLLPQKHTETGLSRVSVYCLLFGLGVSAFWFFVMQQTRYLIPALPAFAVVCAELVSRLWERKDGVARYAASGLIALSALWGIYLAGQQAMSVGPVLSGQVSQEEYVKRTLGGLGAASFWINQNSNKNEKVALFDEVRGFYLDREYAWAQPDHAAGLFPYESYATVDDWLADFKKRGYTLLLEGLPLQRWPDDGKRWRELFKEAIADDKVTLVFEEKGVTVYRIGEGSGLSRQ